MNLDINALLNVAADKPSGKLLKLAEINAAEDSFEQLVDDKLARLDIVLPTPGDLVLLVLPEGELELADRAPGAVAQDEDGALALALLPLPVPIPALVSGLLPGAAQGTATWQLQQLVVESSEAAPREATNAGKLQMLLPEILLQSTGVDSEKATIREAGAQEVMASAEKLPVAASVIQSTASLEVTVGLASDIPEALPQAVISPQVVQMDAALRAIVAPGATPAPVVEQQIGTPAWQHSVSQQIALFTRNGVHNAEIKLHPEDLGSLQINMRMQHDRAQLHIISEHPLVRQAMEVAMPQLRAALAEAGVQLGQANVSADNPQSAGANTDGQKAGQGSGGHDENALSPETEIQHEILTKTDGNIYGINIFA